MTEKQKHIHKLKRLKHKSGNAIFFCALPDCTFKINTALALGKRSICWRCNEPFIMNEYDLRLAKPHCENCHKPKNEVDISSIHLALSPEAIDQELSLSERLNQTIQQAQKTEGEDEL